MLAVGGESVDRHHDRHTEARRDVEMCFQVGHASPEKRQVLLGVGTGERATGHHFRASTVRLQRPHRRHHHHAIWPQTGHPTFDVEELLHAHVGTEAGLGHHVVTEMKRHPVGEDRRIAVGDVGEGPGVHEGGLTLQCLHEIGMKRVLHEDRDGATHTQVVEGDRGTVLGQSHDDPAHSLTQVAERRRIVGAIGQSKDGHQLAGHRYVVATLSRSAVERLLRDR